MPGPTKPPEPLKWDGDKLVMGNEIEDWRGLAHLILDRETLESIYEETNNKRRTEEESLEVNSDEDEDLDDVQMMEANILMIILATIVLYACIFMLSPKSEYTPSIEIVNTIKMFLNYWLLFLVSLVTMISLFK